MTSTVVKSVYCYADLLNIIVEHCDDMKTARDLVSGLSNSSVIRVSEIGLVSCEFIAPDTLRQLLPYICPETNSGTGQIVLDAYEIMFEIILRAKDLPEAQKAIEYIDRQTRVVIKTDNGSANLDFATDAHASVGEFFERHLAEIVREYHKYHVV